MRYLLDTNICIYLIKKQPASLLSHFHSQPVGEIGISSITAAELLYGVEKSRYIAKNQAALEQFLLPLMIEPFDFQAAHLYGKVRNSLEKKGQPIGPLDTLIAAHALRLDTTLITNNEKEFQRVDGLRLENWAI